MLPHFEGAEAIVAALKGRSIVLVGLMGSGKTSVGKRLASCLGLAFQDSDAEIEAAAGMSIAEIFATRGEAEFRDGERRVLARLLKQGPQVLATGGGAFLNAQTRAAVRDHGISIWLKADFEVLMRRVRKRSNRPLLHNNDPEATMRRLIEQRYPIYAKADYTIASNDNPHETVVGKILALLSQLFELSPEESAVLPVEPIIVPVALAERSYEIFIGQGLIASAGERIAALAPGASVAIVSDEHVAQHHLQTLQHSLDDAGIRHIRVVVPPGESSKSYAHFAHVCDAILQGKIERGDVVIALGGGVIGDLAGFAAASLRRGMRFVQIPTSLLAQVDSSVGGKTGINSPFGKNLVGAFYQPILVLADSGALTTLPERELRAGYAEVVKYGLIDDRAFFEWLEANSGGIFANGPQRAQAIARSCRAKAAVVTRDEHETGERALLNLGHTFGHALERLCHFDSKRLVHGEAVAIGMAQAFRISVRFGLCFDHESDRVTAHLRKVGLPTRLSDIPDFNARADEILDAIYQDKKVQNGALTFILARGIGESFIAKGIDPKAIGDFLRAEGAA